MGNSLVIKGNLLCLRKNGGVSKIHIKETRFQLSAKGLAFPQSPELFGVCLEVTELFCL